MKKTFQIHTLGCKVNQYDSQCIRERFQQAGFKQAGSGVRAGVSIINTCTVTASADRKSRNMIRRVIHANPRGRIIVTGCLAKKKETALSGIKGIDYIIGKRFFGDGISDFRDRTRAFLKIQDGCDNFCSYCKVPAVRGPSRSRDIKTIIREALILSEKGFQEIVLTGICLGAYGKDLSPRLSLAVLINDLEKIPGLKRLRLSSIEASDISGALIAQMNGARKLCPHLHIPMQSGDDDILRLMRRKYRRSDYLRIVDEITDSIPGAAVTTDILVGFPGETEAQFNNTVGLIEKIRPLRTHIFPYSPREGTFAFTLGSTAGPDTLQRRIGKLKKTAEACAKEFRKCFIDKIVYVLFENRSKQNPVFWEGYAENYIKVLAASTECLENTIKPVLLTGIQGTYMLGRPLKDN
ncbi:MAG: MiaB/RimO family radical SAM methylthiotransferase [Candidatus Omnitrophica bacterium]|nr:MiaB/RimO family radical SAM methylthiotransferase [Candidatus Omnitrophota bacterium]